MSCGVLDAADPCTDHHDHGDLHNQHRGVAVGVPPAGPPGASASAGLLPEPPDPEPGEPGRAEPTPPRERPRARTSGLALVSVRTAGVALALFLLGGMLQVVGTPPPVWWAAYLGCVAVGGWERARVGVAALLDREERRLDVDLLMVLAAVGAVAIGQVFDGGLLIVIFATSAALEELAGQRTEDSVRSLLEVAPQQVGRLRPDGTEERVAPDVLVPDDRILVRPGERIGADGRIVDGAGDVDQAAVTGEPLPVARAVGDDVYAGTLNRTGALQVQVTRTGEDTVVARIVALVDEARDTRAPTQLLVERIEQHYSLVVVGAAVALFVGPLVFGAAVEPTLLRAMTFMIVASPCALVLATMPPLLAAIANAGRRGVLVRSAAVMERMAGVTRVAFDKTGTLTTGSPEVVAVHVLPGTGRTEGDVLRHAAAVERQSEHPVAAAVVAHARSRGIGPPGATEFTARPGRGVDGIVDGVTVCVGHAGYVLGSVDLDGAGPPDASVGRGPDAPSDRAGGPGPAVPTSTDRPSTLVGGSITDGPSGAGRARALVASAENAGRTAVVVAIDARPVGVVEVVDRIRPGAATAVARIRSLTPASPVLLTGDNKRAAARLGDTLELGDVRAGLLPEDKLGAVREFQAGGDQLMVVGDGLNDAPALAAADVGVAMGGIGSDLTIEAADVIVTRDDPDTVPTVLELSRRARRVLRQNLVIAASAIVVLVTWDLVGHLPLPLGVALHEGSTIVVALNGLRLLGLRARGSRQGP